VTAIEPLPEMLELLPAAAPGAFAVLGNAEVIPLPDASADVVAAAQAFHWFDLPVALPEIARVLRSRGRLALVWNKRDDREPWVARLSETIGSETVESEDVETPIAASGLYGPVERATFEWAQKLDRALVRDLVLSRSYCAIKPPDLREEILANVERLFDEHASGGVLELPYVTVCYRASKVT
jgi:SAM-dependent methyltransferase